MTDTNYDTDTDTDTEQEAESDANPGGRSEPQVEVTVDVEGMEADADSDGVSIADPDVSPAAVERVVSLLEDGALADGPEVRAFEEEFAAYCGTENAVATSNGTTALHAALEAFGVEDGDAVVTSPFSFVASANAIRLAGGKPVFADIDPETYTLDPEAVERVVRDRSDVVGILPVHLYGLPADVPALVDVADDHDLFVLEDACQAHGAEVDGERAGELGDAACFSFYPTKNMTTGEGGAVATDREDVAERVTRYVNHGRAESGTGGYDHVELGHNYRLTSPAAAIGRHQLERLPEFTETRRENAAYYDEELAELPVETPTAPDGYRHVYHQYTIRSDDRDALAGTLEDRGVDTAVYYGTPIHRQPAYETVSTAAARFPEAERAADEVLSLPVHPGVSESDRRTVVDAVYEHYE
ncbi:dTDP-4-amino-4,6-dideoxygalactose transaminase [Halobiforma haloterrestris]|uniref:dTDP-4-amino-4,6-dideoxygalactose transaminase n=1 Tax=Natronobacterium haloterrestre TaxID=148448 RepID=A0A1I1F983_NATHA|nr:DegT/DnrJ/EryC1/StrS family aminotransferase [Halobiforma haloterrestris]SFB93640.1 dTDP-4-amino-4,6-dideoxygalactose transaminase [Halobiforma haloterrestris]